MYTSEKVITDVMTTVAMEDSKSPISKSMDETIKLILDYIPQDATAPDVEVIGILLKDHFVEKFQKRLRSSIFEKRLDARINTEIKEYIDRKVPVLIVDNVETAERKFAVVIDEGKQDFWLDAFDTEEEAIEFCVKNELPYKN